MPVKVIESINGTKIYELTAGKEIPAWLSRAQRSRLAKRDPTFAGRIELIQGFSFPNLATKIRISRDSNYALATGLYTPRIHVYDLPAMTLKFARHLDFEPADVCFLSDDFRKLAVIGTDRSVELHNQGGKLFRIRVPKAPRCVVYDNQRTSLLIAGSAPELWRLDLQMGAFAPSVGLGEDVIDTNALAVSQLHGISFAGVTSEGKTKGGILAFDSRAGPRAVWLVATVATVEGGGVTALACGGAGNTPNSSAPHLLACGTSMGVAMLFDLRSCGCDSVPLARRDHRNGESVHTVAIHEGRVGFGLDLSDTTYPLILSGDSSGVKAWDSSDCSMRFAVPYTHPLNNFVVCTTPGVDGLPRNTGLILGALEAPRLAAHYIPSLGVCPSWSPALEGALAEASETALPSQYSDFTFITLPEMKALGIDTLVGTSRCTAYMHGFYVPKAEVDRAEKLSQSHNEQRWKNIRTRDAIQAKQEEAVLHVADAINNAKLGEDGQRSKREVARDRSYQKARSDPRFSSLLSSNNRNKQGNNNDDEEEEHIRRRRPNVPSRGRFSRR